jgi:hypothetical protein
MENFGFQSYSSSASSGLNYQGTWNALTNSPLLTSGVGTSGNYYIVTVAGNTNLDGVTDWSVGDWAIFNGTNWQKIDNSGISYQGTWDALTNNPTLTSSVGFDGHFYIVSVAGATNLNGIASWNIGDWAIFTGGVWLKINNASGIGGSGTTNYVSKFTAAGAIGNSQIFDNGTNVGIGTASPTAKLQIISPNVTAGAYGIKWDNSTASRQFYLDNDGSLILVGRQTINWANGVSFTAFDIIAQTGQIFNVSGSGSGSVLIGTGGTDSSSKLLVRGIDATSSNYALKVVNSAGNPLLYVKNDGAIDIYGTITPRLQNVTSAATVTPTNLNDEVVITAQAVGLTLANPTGTALQGQSMMIRIKDNAIAQTIAYGTQYRAIGVTLPTTTVISKTLYLGLIYNSTDTKWDVIGVAQEA